MVNKKIVIALSIWSFIHTYLLMQGYEEREGIKFSGLSDYFYPFSHRYFDVFYYGGSEFLVYVGGAWLTFVLFRYYKKE